MEQNEKITRPQMHFGSFASPFPYCPKIITTDSAVLVLSPSFSSNVTTSTFLKHLVPTKWSSTSQTCSKCCKVFKVCLTIFWTLGVIGSIITLRKIQKFYLISWCGSEISVFFTQCLFLTNVVLLSSLLNRTHLQYIVLEFLHLT